MFQINKYLKNAFIAGDFFIKYKRDKFKKEETYKKFCSKQEINIYVNIGNDSFAPDKKELLSSIHEKYRNEAVFKEVFFKSVFATFKIDKVGLIKEIINNVVIHICSVPCTQMLRKFTFEPSKIAYCYNAKCLTVCKWFLDGGSFSKKDKTKWALKLRKRSLKKNINEEAEKPTGTRVKVEFVIRD